MDELGEDILSIALPALLALAADPLSSLVDTAFVGHLGIHHFPFLCFLFSIINLANYSACLMTIFAI